MSFGGLPGIMKYAWANNLTYYNYNVTMAKHYFEKAGYHIPAGGKYFVNNSTGAMVQFLIQEPSAVADWVASGTPGKPAATVCMDLSLTERIQSMLSA